MWGDGVALLSADTRPGSGVSDRGTAYMSASRNSDKALDALNTVVPETDTWLDYSKQGHDKTAMAKPQKIVPFAPAWGLARDLSTV